MGGEPEESRQGLREPELHRQAGRPVEPDEEQLSLLVQLLSDYLGTAHL